MTQDADALRQRLEKYDGDRAGFVIHMSIFLIVNALLWGIWSLSGGFSSAWPWPLLLTLTWGSGFAAHALDFRSHSPRHLARIDDRAVDQMAAIYGPDWQDTTTEADYERIYKAVHQSARQRTEFAIHLTIYMFINALAWFIWVAAYGLSGFPLPVLLTALWGIGLTAHGLSNYFDSAQRVVDREKTVQQMTTGQVKKKKRMERLMLTDDGEFLEVVDEQSEDDQNVQLSSH